MKDRKLRRALRPDAQGFDEVRITTVPRFKQSSLSGDEWRISAKVEFLRKGAVKHEEQYRNVETACAFLGVDILRAGDNGKAYYAGEGNLCDQEGCAEKATHWLLVKVDCDCRCGRINEHYQGDSYRAFCDRHKIRGDCGLDDADDNYESIEEPAT